MASRSYAPRREAKWKKVIGLAIGTSLSCAPASAGDFGAVIAAQGTAALIRLNDPMVRTIRTSIPAQQGTTTECGTIDATAASQAFYCPKDKSISISSQMLDRVENDYGAEGVIALVAHEFGHARQDAIKGFTRDFIITPVVDELQADCIAGVYMKRASPVGLSEQQVDHAAMFLGSLGSYVPIERDWHGTPEMRRAAFMRGYGGGSFEQCYATNKSSPGTLIRKSVDTIYNQLEQDPGPFENLLKWGKQTLDSL